MLIVDSKGVIVDLVNAKEAGDNVEFYDGIISPGFINCHCHLELSHLKGKIPKHTGLIDFLLKIVEQRFVDDETIQNAIANDERTKRLDPSDPRYLPEADELNYGVRNKYATGPFEDILNQFKGKITRVRLAYLTPGFSIKPHVDYDPSYITRYHIPLITNDNVVMGFSKGDATHLYHMPADGSVFFFNSGIKHWVDNNGTEARLHLIIDTHGQEDLVDYTECPEMMLSV